jgi:hypothetical protein
MSESPKRTAESVDAPVLESVDQKKAKARRAEDVCAEYWAIFTAVYNGLSDMKEYLDPKVDDEDEPVSKGDAAYISSRLKSLAEMLAVEQAKLSAIVAEMDEDK